MGEESKRVENIRIYQEWMEGMREKDRRGKKEEIGKKRRRKEEGGIRPITLEHGKKLDFSLVQMTKGLC